MNTYPLTGAQKMHQIWIEQYGTQQVSNVSVVAALQSPLQFGLLKQCIEMEIARNECLRVRFTAPDEMGEVQQYVVPFDARDIEMRNLSEMTLQEADHVMQKWAYNTFDGDNIPMCEFFLMKLPDGYNGFFLHVDHRLLDSCGLVVTINDIMKIYAHFRFGTDMPEPLASFTQVLRKDLAKASPGTRRFEKDRKFWQDQIDTLGEPIYTDIQGLSVLQEARKKHNDKTLRAGDIETDNLMVKVKDYILEADSTKGLMDFCMNHEVSMNNVLLLGLRTYLSRVNGGQEDVSIMNFISRRSTHEEWTSGGSRTVAFPCRTVISPDTEFLDALYEVQNVQNRIYMHANYDPALIRAQYVEKFPIPVNTTYESVWLTYQPMPVAVDNPYIAQIPQHAVWFANGAATKKLYLTVSYTDRKEMRFSFHYQVAHLEEHDIELLYYYLMKLLFTGIASPDTTIGELMHTL
ncbi:MAG: condensation domain-containing protein [Lachnospiraceae bacterium]|nr:condensation domain-containing protein [Lachnospiraceae bacterium]